VRPDRVTQLLQDRASRLDTLAARLGRAARVQLERRAAQFAGAERMLSTLGYEATLARGYAVVRSEDRLITSRAEAAKAAILEIQFADGRLTVGAKPAGKAPKQEPPEEQGSLF
jgi:exodeoxyribonuclease VII large subunit